MLVPLTAHALVPPPGKSIGSDAADGALEQPMAASASAQLDYHGSQRMAKRKTATGAHPHHAVLMLIDDLGYSDTGYMGAEYWNDYWKQDGVVARTVLKITP